MASANSTGLGDYLDAAALVSRAAAGDELAWGEIVARYTPMLRAITRSCGLPPTSGNDVIQTTWLRLAEGISHIREPEYLRTWLATVTRREAWRAATAFRNSCDTEDLDPLLPPTVGPEEDVLAEESRRELRAAIQDLPGRQRTVILQLTADPPASYQQIAEQTGMPIGSIGPTRARALARLKERLEGVHSQLRPLSAAPAAL